MLSAPDWIADQTFPSKSVERRVRFQEHAPLMKEIETLQADLAEARQRISDLRLALEKCIRLAESQELDEDDIAWLVQVRALLASDAPVPKEARHEDC
jgi:hypothetical protein